MRVERQEQRRRRILPLARTSMQAKESGGERVVRRKKMEEERRRRGRRRRWRFRRGQWQKMLRVTEFSFRRERERKKEEGERDSFLLMTVIAPHRVLCDSNKLAFPQVVDNTFYWRGHLFYKGVT